MKWYISPFTEVTFYVISDILQFSQLLLIVLRVFPGILWLSLIFCVMYFLPNWLLLVYGKALNFCVWILIRQPC